MQRVIRQLCLGLGILVLGGCAAMSDAACRAGDWYGAGEKDGRNGREDRLADYAEACQKVGVLPDPAEYAKGRERGLLAYCTPENGYREGREGRSYQNVCAPELQAGFLQHYERGRLVYELRRDIERLENDLRRWSGELAVLQDKIRKAASDEERKRLRREWHDLDRARRDAEVRLQLLHARQLMSADH
ncbi:DUF2799 domain-containing protein [Chitinimonas sp. BJYL2]|uniref:DUF2799 domain-containing protein n=1 Tax=Chitinimonas sp. BJYL2 TaxID=2976696 RepID=UPI0022B501D7|nr:DUF2799 domain-containing protein [Chitinimonas sp. BJYL2]